MLALAAAPLTLAALDLLDRSADLVAFVAEDERPLRGLAGLIDWRLCGALTRQVKEGRFAGRAGEALLTVSGGRLRAERIFLFGVGPAARASRGRPGFWAHEALAVASRAGSKSVATWMPSWGELPVNLLARALVEAARDNGIGSVTLLHPDERAADRALAVAAETFPGVRLASAEMRR